MTTQGNGNGPPEQEPPEKRAQTVEREQSEEREQREPAFAEADHPATVLKHPDSAIAGFIISLIGVLICWIPLLGLLGFLGLILGLIPLLSRGGAKKYSLAITAIVLGSISGVVGIIWINAIATSSCPHVYSYDGESYALDADPLSGALFSGGEGRDMDRLEHLAAVGGQYRIKVVNERDESDHINDIALHVVDHADDVEVLPTQAGVVVGLTNAVAPTQCSDHRQRDQRAALADDDETYFTGTTEGFSQSSDDPLRERLTCTFARPEGDEAILVLRAHNTEFAAETFVAYLAEMGPGVGPLIEWAEGVECCPGEEYIKQEMRRLGLVLDVRVGNSNRWSEPIEVEPIGPAVFRSQAVVIPLPAYSGDEISIQLELAPLLWEIDQVLLGEPARAEATILRPRIATIQAGSEVTPLLLSRDESRVSLERGDHVEVESDAPQPLPNRRRTVVLEISGYYDFDVGGRAWLNPLAVFQHQTGRSTLPRFALQRAQSQQLR